ncbi:MULTISPECIES: efflux RND transporter permease subunit [unclassified Butyrivibrio]|uniref:efflux RND transporter permease subunit n=1 Tax=unclassified Butyrivibrio TaxID=2639466 RepID=UPI0004046973|nr:MULTISPECIES: MMPL family transporter [unclassified Butyrivibrio]
MKFLSKAIVKSRFIILIASIALMIPCLAGMAATRVNYDILSYLPGEIETMKGQDILMDQFGTGAYSLFVVEGMADKDIAALKSDIEKVEHVKKVLWYDSFMDYTIPKEMLPDKLTEALGTGDAQMMFIIFDDTTSGDGTMDAITNIRKIANEKCFLSGMAAIVLDTKNLTEKETPIYVGMAVLLAVIVLSLTMDSYLIPFFFLASIGIAIMFNMGTNIFLGEISFLTKSLSAVLQLGVTLDYSIFLWHSYQEEIEKGTDDKKEAMANAICATFQSVIGSSITTIAGFVALCFMSFTIGLDLGIVMAKGVIFGVIACVTVLPSMILIADKIIVKTKHKPVVQEFTKIPRWISRHAIVFGVIFLCLLPPALWGYKHAVVYYDLSETLPDKLPSRQAMIELEKNFETNTTYMILADANLDSATMQGMVKELKSVDGVDAVLGLDALVGPSLPRDMIPSELRDELSSDQYQMLMLTSEYKTASDEVNTQIDRVNSIVKKYSPSAMVVGEAPCTKDLITITDKDFKTVSVVSIGCVFLIIALVMKSISLPFILVAVIEFAIFINMGIPGFTGTVIPFISSVVIGTIQLGATVDYAILMTTRYCKERKDGQSKKQATRIALSTSMKSIIVSALSFFAATFGVGLVSSVDMIGSLCFLMARGALISMVVVIFVLPSMYMIFDGLIIRTTWGMLNCIKMDKERKISKTPEIKHA